MAELKRRRLRDNVAITLTTQLLSWGLAVGVTFFIPGYLGERNLGSLTLAIAFAGLFGVFISFGTSTVLIQEVARDPRNARHLVHTSLKLRATLGVSLLLLGLTASALFGYSRELQLLVGLMLLAQLIGQVTETFQAALTGLEAFVQQSGAALAEKLTLSVVAILLVFLKAPLWQFAAVYALSTTMSAIVSGTAFRRIARTLPEEAEGATIRSMKQLAKAGVPFLTTRVFATIYGDGSSALLMSKLSTLEAIGWFGLAKRFSGAAQMVPIALASALLPRLTRLHHEGDRSGFALLAWRMIGVAFAAALPVAVILVVFPSELIDLLHYPAGFAGAVPVLRLSGCVLFLWFVQQAVGAAVIAAGKQKLFAYVSGAAACLAFPISGAGIWAGERFLQNGAVGAMAGDAVLELFMLLLYFRALIPELFSRAPTDTVPIDTVPIDPSASATEPLLGDSR